MRVIKLCVHFDKLVGRRIVEIEMDDVIEGMINGHQRTILGG